MEKYSFDFPSPSFIFPHIQLLDGLGKFLILLLVHAEHIDLGHA